jgi:predicted nucleic acid-binding protein
MRKLVADASAILAVLLDEPAAAEVRSASQNCELIAPGSLPWEIGNALVLGLREERLTLEMATAALREYESIPIRQTAIDRAEALAVAEAEGIYAYDAYMLTCAHHHSTPLLTLDLQLRSVARRRELTLRPSRIEGDERYE